MLSSSVSVTSCSLSRLHVVRIVHVHVAYAGDIETTSMTEEQTTLTPRSAIFFGLVCVAVSAVPILGGLRVIDLKPAPDTPQWLGVAAGGAFLLAGLTLIVDGVSGGIGPDGQLSADAPPWLHVFQSLMGLGIVATMGALVSWIAFGPGQRHFSTTISLPFGWWRPKSSDTTGRWVFGIAAVLIWCIIAGVIVASVRRLIVRARLLASRRVGQ